MQGISIAGRKVNDGIDFYATPDWAVDKILEVAKLEGIVMEPCSGNGAFASKIPNCVASDIRTVCLDVKMFDNFRDMMKQLLIITFQDGKFSVEDTMVSKEDFIDENSEAEICYQITCLLEDFSMNGIYMLLMIKNYDEVKEKWTPSNFGWIRGVMCDNQNLSIIQMN